MKRLSSLRLNGAPTSNGVGPKPDSKIDRHEDRTVSGNAIPNVWTVMQKWINALPKETPKQRARNGVLQEELNWLIKELGGTQGIGSKDLVFAHCDLLSGNVIIQSPHAETTTPTTTTSTESEALSVGFIDYEYATPAPAAFDLANHFAEWGGFDCDFSVLPTRAQRRDFLKEYLQAYNAHINRTFQPSDLDALVEQTDRFRGVPGFYWGIWALIQATISQIEFDYASYAEVRLGEFWAWKAELDGSRAQSKKEMPLREKRWAEE
jgi:ethanolamine kinase